MDYLFYISPTPDIRGSLSHIGFLYLTETQANEAAIQRANKRNRPHFVFRIELYDGFKPQTEPKTETVTKT